MSAPITEAHLALAAKVRRNDIADVRYVAHCEAAQLIADSEAKALSVVCGRHVALIAERDQLRAELGHLHGRIGLFAKAHFGINDNLPTDETFAQMSHALQMERTGLAVEEEKLRAELAALIATKDRASAAAVENKAEADEFHRQLKASMDDTRATYARAERAEAESERYRLVTLRQDCELAKERARLAQLRKDVQFVIDHAGKGHETELGNIRCSELWMAEQLGCALDVTEPAP
jgi:hypothetical protein